MGTLTETHSKGATLAIARVHAKQIGIMWKTCGGCGSFQLIVGTTKYAPTNTKGSVHYYFATAKAFSKVKTVTVKIVAYTAGRIQIDGLIALVIGPLSFSPPSGVHRSAPAGWR